MLFLVVNLLVALVGFLSLIFGIVGVGVMTWVWRILHVLIGLLLLLSVMPYLLDHFFPPKK